MAAAKPGRLLPRKLSQDERRSEEPEGRVQLASGAHLPVSFNSRTADSEPADVGAIPTTGTKAPKGPRAPA